MIPDYASGRVAQSRKRRPIRRRPLARGHRWLSRRRSDRLGATSTFRENETPKMAAGRQRPEMRTSIGQIPHTETR